MRVLIAGFVALQLTVPAPGAAQPPPKPASPKAGDSPAAERTRNKLLKVKVTGDFKNVPLRDILKEFAAQVEMQAERPVMWTYPGEVPAGDAVTYMCRHKPLEQALDELFTPRKLGYVVISDDDAPRDGWVRIAPGRDRGFAAGEKPAAAGDEQKAASTLALARGLIDKGKGADARAILMLVVTKYPGTKAAAEARELLEKLKK